MVSPSISLSAEGEPQQAPAGAVRRTRPVNRPRVFIVSDCPGFHPPYTLGGTERQLSDLARTLGSLGADVTVVARAWKAGLDGRAQACSPDGIRTVLVPPVARAKGSGWSALLPNLAFIRNVFLHLLRERRGYDVLIVSGFRQLAMPLGLVARLARKRCIVRIETTWDLDDELSAESSARMGHAARLLARALIRTARRITFALVDRIVVFSDPLEKRVIRLGAPGRKVMQIPNGIDVRRFAPVRPEVKRALRERLGLPLDRSIFVYTGRICRSKGVPELLRVWERCVARDDLYLLLVGSDSGAHDSCELEAREFAERHPSAVKLTGSVQNVAQYLKASDVFMFLSHGEAFGLSVLEAVAVGLPCIATDVGCVRQVVRHRDWGAIVPVGADSDRLLQEIGWMQSQRARWQRMGARARSGVVESFALEAVAGRYLALAGGGRPAPEEIIGAHERPTPVDPLVRDPRRTPDRRAAPRAR